MMRANASERSIHLAWKVMKISMTVVVLLLIALAAPPKSKLLVGVLVDYIALQVYP